MANNMSNGSSWSLAGESSIYSKDDDPPYKALYGVRKEKRQGIYQTEGMACSVLVKIKDHGEVVCFVTWSGVTKDFNKPAQVNRFSSHFGKYSLQVDSDSTVATFGRFSFLPVGPIINSTSNAPSSKRNDSLVVLAFKAPEKEELTSDLEAYCFVGSEKLLLKLEFQEDTKLHKPVTFSGEDRQKLEWSSVLGAPIIVKNKRSKSSSNIGVWSVVGILGLSQEQELCPYFVTNEIFAEQEASVHSPNEEIKSHDTSGQPEEKATGNPSGEQEVDAPGQPEEKATANPSGEQEVDAPGQSVPSDPISQTPANPPGQSVPSDPISQTPANPPGQSVLSDVNVVSPPISQTPENTTNPLGEEVADASVVGHHTMPDFKKRLFDIAQRITSDTLIEMKFICDLPDGVKNSIDDPLKFLGALEKRGKIYPGDVTYLVSLLEETDNLKLARFVRQTVMPGKSWNFKVSHGKSWKIIIINGKLIIAVSKQG
ncbi:uncharacterized protein [Montipora capricornis]|uniref:uncharacterized protein n=1 Tax=Montipora capricornis TaxID=246305 RepID=UPI0035F1138A